MEYGCALKQIAQQVQFLESQNRHQERQHHRQAIELAGGHAHQHECHQYSSDNGRGCHTGAIFLGHLKTLLSAVIPRRVRRGSPWAIDKITRKNGFVKSVLFPYNIGRNL